MDNQLRSYLSRLNVSGYRYKWDNLPLEKLISKAKISLSRGGKAEMINALEKYLMDINNLKAIWERLSELEKAIVTDAVTNQCYLIESEFHRLCEAYNEPEEKFNNGSLMSLYFIDGKIPRCIADKLETFIQQPRMTLKGEIVNGKTLREYHVFRIKEQLLAGDWIKLVKLAGGGKLKVTKVGQYPTKPVLKNINKELTHQEYESSYIHINYMKNGGEASRLYGLITHMLAAGVLGIEGTDLILGTKSKQFLALPFAEQAQLLYKAYKESRTYNEVSRIKESKLQASLPENLYKVREKICDLLTNLPEGEWINMNSLSEQIYKCWRTFLVEEVHYISQKETSYYYASIMENWEEVERRYLDIVLLEGLVPLGLFEVALKEEVVHQEYTFETTHYFSVAYVKMTPLGAYVLGKNKEYVDPTMKDKVANDLWVDDELVVHVGDSTKRYQHEIFFEQFCEKAGDEEQSCYVLDFYAALKAFNERIGLTQILEYLNKQATKPLPKHLERVFKRWAQDQTKVKITNMMVIECEDAAIMEDLLSSSVIQKSEGRQVRHSIAFPKKHLNKVKKEIEKKNYFCKVEIEQGEDN